MHAAQNGSNHVCSPHGNRNILGPIDLIRGFMRTLSLVKAASGETLVSSAMAKNRNKKKKNNGGAVATDVFEEGARDAPQRTKPYSLFSLFFFYFF